jgi:hypothetical protein
MGLTEQPLNPPEPSVWLDGRGWAPVPGVCPLCGHKTRRCGNASDRRVYCMNPAMHTTPAGFPSRVCQWHTTVFGGHR